MSGRPASLLRRPLRSPGTTRGLHRELLTPLHPADDAVTALLDGLEADLPPAPWALRVVGRPAVLGVAAEVAAAAGLETRPGGPGAFIATGRLDRCRVLVETASGVSRPVLLLRAGADSPAVEALAAGDVSRAVAEADLAVLVRPGDAHAVLQHDPQRSGLVAAGGAEVDAPAEPGARAAAWRRPAAALAAALVAASLIAVGVRTARQPGPPGPAVAPIATAVPRPPGPLARGVAVPVRPGPVPTLRQQPASALDAATGTTLLEGGVVTVGAPNAGPGTTPSVDSAETWTWRDGVWRQQLSGPGVGPPARHGALLTPDPTASTPGSPAFLLVGGYAGADALRDAWRWKDGRWSPVPTAAPPGTPFLMAADPGRRTVVLVVTGGDGNRDTAVLGDDHWTLLHTPTPSLRLVADGSAIGVLGLALPDGELATTARTWTWTGAAWLPAGTGAEPEVDQLTAELTPVPGPPLLAEVEVVGADSQRGGTWVRRDGGWQHVEGPVPDLLNSFDTATPVWAVSAGRPVLLGGLAGDAGYVRAATWTGAGWTAYPGPPTAP